MSIDLVPETLEHLGHSAVNFVHANPLLMKGALVVGGVALAVIGTRWLLGKVLG